MRSGVSILGLVMTLGCRPAAPPQQQIDVVGIKAELLVIGQASLDDLNVRLNSKGAPSIPMVSMPRAASSHDRRPLPQPTS